MGEEGIIINHEDSVDFKIYEGDGSDDRYQVLVSTNWEGPWTNLGLVTGTTMFDLNDFSVEEARFIKIVDDSDGNAYETNPGCDIDAIEHIIPFINNPPEAPDISGPSNGKPGIEYDYTFTTTDPELDNVYFYIKWGDGYIEQWEGPFESGEDFTIGHTWSQEGEYTIEVKAKDTYDEESPWSEFTVTMPRSKASNNPFFLIGNSVGYPSITEYCRRRETGKYRCMNA